MPGYAYWLGGALLGAIVGSFVAVVALRWPAGRSIGGRSACDGCGARLRAWELVPLVSHALLRGRCARCGAPIDPLHVVAEALGALIGGVALAAVPGWAWLGWPGLGWPGLAGALLGWMLLALALIDLRHFWLPDRLTLPLLAAGLACGPAAPADRLIGAAVGWLVLWLVAAGYRRLRGRIGLGGGDAKLFGALGAWLGWAALPSVLLGASLIGLGWGLLLHLRGKQLSGSSRLPFGPMLALAGWGAWLAAVAG